MACGYGACFGCAVPKPDGGYMRLCVDGPVVRVRAEGRGSSARGDRPARAWSRRRRSSRRELPTLAAADAAVDFCG